MSAFTMEHSSDELMTEVSEQSPQIKTMTDKPDMTIRHMQMRLDWERYVDSMQLRNAVGARI